MLSLAIGLVQYGITLVGPCVEKLTELSNLARLRRPPSTILSRLISVLPSSLGFPDDEPGAPSPLLYPFILSFRLSPFDCDAVPRFLLERGRAFLLLVLAEALRRSLRLPGDTLRRLDDLEPGRDMC